MGKWVNGRMGKGNLSLFESLIEN